MIEDPSLPEPDTFLIVGPAHLLGDEAAQRRIAEAMAELFPEARFLTTAAAPAIEDIALVPIMGTVGDMGDGQVQDHRRPLSADRMQEMQDALEGLARDRPTLN